MSGESIKPPSTSDNSLAPSLNCIITKSRVKFQYQCLKQNKITFTHRNIVKIYIVYETNLWNRVYDDYLVLKNSLFGAVKWIINADIDKYKYLGYGIELDTRRTFSVSGGLAEML